MFGFDLRLQFTIWAINLPFSLARMEEEEEEERLAVKELRVEPPGGCSTLPESPSSVLAEYESPNESPHLIKFGWIWKS